MTTQSIAKVLPAVFSILFTTLHADVTAWYLTNVATTSTNWSEGIWYTSDGQQTGYPNSNEIGLSLYWQQKGIAVDDNYTIGRILSNPSMSCTVGGICTIDLYQTVPGGFDATLNLDGTNVDYSLTSNFGSELTSSDYFYAITLNTGSFKAGQSPNSEIVFSGGTVNIDDPINQREILLTAAGTKGEVETDTVTKTITFDANNTLNLKQNTTLSGTRIYSDSTGIINFNGTTNIKGEDGQLKNLTLYTDATSGARSLRSITANVGEDGTLTAGNVYLYKNTSFNVAGKADIQALDMTGGESDATVSNGGTLNVAQSVTLGTGGETLTVNGTLNAANIVMSTGFSHNTTNKANFVLNKGGEVNATYFRTYCGCDVTIDGKLNLSGSISAASLYINNSSLLLGENAYLNSTDSSAIFQIGGAAVTIKSGEGALKLASGIIKNDALYTEIVFDSSNPFSKSDTVGQEGIVFQNRIITTEGNYGSMSIVLNANQDFNSFTFSTDKQYNSYIITLNDAVTELNLTSLSNGTLNATTNGMIIIDGFKLNTIHFDTWADGDNLKLVSSLNGDWVDFTLVSDGGTGYYLSATYIPEPSIFAALFGFISIAVAARKRK